MEPTADPGDQHDDAAPRTTNAAPRPWWRRLLIRILRTLALAYAAILLLVWIFQGRLLYQPDREVSCTPASRRIPYEDVTLVTGDGVRLGAWWIPGPEDRPVVLFCHGNAGDIGDRVFVAELLHRHGYGLLLFDYRGYGSSAGTPDEAGTYQDGLAAWHHLSADRGIPPERIVLWGRSLGGGIATWLAERVPARGLLLDSAFTSVPDRAAQLYPFLPVRLLCRHTYDNRERLARLALPVVIVHGERDRLIPFSHALALRAAAAGPCRLVRTGGTHNGGLMSESASYLESLALLAGGPGGFND